MLHFEHIRHAYKGKTSVHDISFLAKAGEVVSLLGPSGAVKQPCGWPQALNNLKVAIRLHEKLISSEEYLQPPNTVALAICFKIMLFPHLTVSKMLCLAFPTGCSYQTRA